MSALVPLRLSEFLNFFEIWLGQDFGGLIFWDYGLTIFTPINRYSENLHNADFRQIIRQLEPRKENNYLRNQINGRRQIRPVCRPAFDENIISSE